MVRDNLNWENRRVRNVDRDTVEHFGLEWSYYDQSSLTPEDRRKVFDKCFSIFPWHELDERAVGFDLGCGSGRWAIEVAPRVRKLYCIDPSPAALDVARKNLEEHDNCVFVCASVDNLPIEDGTMDFGYALGVLHHVPDTAAAIRDCARKLKPGAPFLVYIYYAFENRPFWFRALWRISDCFRRIIYRLPFLVKLLVTNAIAVLIYWPAARCATILEKCGFNVAALPLSAYRSRPLYMMRTDALDRFGTKIEKRFTRAQIEEMLCEGGFKNVRFRTEGPGFWIALAYRRGV